MIFPAPASDEALADRARAHGGGGVFTPFSAGAGGEERLAVIVPAFHRLNPGGRSCATMDGKGRG